METKHTPGPWRLSGPDYPHGAVIQRRDEGGFVVKGRTPESQSADAYLIAAAPELLAALEIIVASEEFHGDSFVCDFGTLQGVARAAIAKAKGRLVEGP